jgi:hypothetical protein
MPKARLRTPPFGLSPNGYVVLSFLRRGSAFQVRGAWRIRGLRRCVQESALFCLRRNGLAERVETGRYIEFQITPAGRTAYSKPV